MLITKSQIIKVFRQNKDYILYSDWKDEYGIYSKITNRVIFCNESNYKLSLTIFQKLINKGENV